YLDCFGSKPATRIVRDAMHFGSISTAEHAHVAMNSTLHGHKRAAVPDTLVAAAAAKLPPHKLQCFSVACHDMPQLEFGDKIILPSKILLELQCYHIPPPLLFRVRSFAAGVDNDDCVACEQHCSVQEFSAPDGNVFLPYWMMENLRVGEGDTVLVSIATQIPRGIYCRLQPEATDFLDLAAEVGPKVLLENAFRRYSVLSLKETIMIEYGTTRYFVRVIELKPATVVSLCGDVDLEVDFTAPEHSDPKRPLSGSRQTPRSHSASNSIPSPPKHSQAPEEPLALEAKTVFGLGVGRRLGDGGYVMESVGTLQSSGLLASATKKKPTVATSALRTAQELLDARKPLATASTPTAPCASPLAKHIRQAQGAFSTPGHPLGTVTSPHHRSTQQSPSRPEESPEKTEEMQREYIARHSALDNQKDVGPDKDPLDGNAQSVCPLCLAEVSAMSVELHAVRCARNPASHRFECSVCRAKVLKSQGDKHRHCDQCSEVVESDDALQAHVLAEHRATFPCPLCKKLMLLKDIAAHTQESCLEAMEKCAVCSFTFKRKEKQQHLKMCATRTERCDECRQYVKVTEYQDHIVLCQAKQASLLEENQREEIESRVVPTVNTHACAYCNKSGFQDSQHLDRHLVQECLVARSFQVPAVNPAFSLRRTDKNHDSDVRAFVQGRIRRKGDVKTLQSIKLSPRSGSKASHGAKSTNNTIAHDSTVKTAKSTHAPQVHVRATAAIAKIANPINHSTTEPHRPDVLLPVRTVAAAPKPTKTESGRHLGHARASKPPDTSANNLHLTIHARKL
ncbi:TPA: hypothetical protein N0F65_007582, partial [Lagenidium giganteum]